MWVLVTILFVGVPTLQIWWMLRVQRRLRERIRGRWPNESPLPETPAYEAPEHGDDGLSYGRATLGDGLPAAGLTPEIHGIQALQGRR